MENMDFDFWHIRNFKYKEGPFIVASLTFPGLNYESFDRSGNPKLTSLMYAVYSARSWIYQAPLPSPHDKKEEDKYFLDIKYLRTKFMRFASTSECVMSRDLYDQKVSKGPLDIALSLDNVGNHSYSQTGMIYACDGGKDGTSKTPIYSETFQLVTVDRITRKTVKLPEWFRSKYKGKGRTNKGLVLNRFDRPAVTYAHPHVVKHSDTDHYGHTNYRSYPAWAIDALHAAIFYQNTTTSPGLCRDSSNTCDTPSDDSPCSKAQRALHGISEEIIAHGLRKTQIIYLRECLEGEFVEIHVWQNEKEEKQLVYCSIVKDGQDIFQMKMWYFD